MPIFRAEEEGAVRGLLARLERPVELALVLGPYSTTTLAGAREIDPEVETRRILAGLAELSELVTVSEHGEGALGADRYPAVVLLRDGADTGVRFYGTPWGYELTSIVGAVLEAGTAKSSLLSGSTAALAALDVDLDVEVYVTPTCPHCPRAVLLAYRAALASPRVTAAGVEATEFPALADRYGVLAVPKVVVNGVPRYEGSVPEHVFVERLLASGRDGSPTVSDTVREL